MLHLHFESVPALQEVGIEMCRGRAAQPPHLRSRIDFISHMHFRGISFREEREQGNEGAAVARARMRRGTLEETPGERRAANEGGDGARCTLRRERTTASMLYRRSAKETVVVLSRCASREGTGRELWSLIRIKIPQKACQHATCT